MLKLPKTMSDFKKIREAGLLNLLLLCSFTYSMEIEVARNQIETEFFFSVLNTVNHKIALCLQYEGEEPCTLTLIPQQQMALPLAGLETVYVIPYGKYKEWISKTKLTGGLLAPTNVALELHQEWAKHPQGPLVLLVQVGAQYFGTGWLRALFGTVAPYVYDIRALQLREQKYYSQVVSLFPQAELISRNEIPHPRFVLNLTQDASQWDIEKAYRLLKKMWERKSMKSEFQLIAPLALALIEIAYKSLRLNDAEREDGSVLFKRYYEECRHQYIPMPDASL